MPTLPTDRLVNILHDNVITHISPAPTPAPSPPPYPVDAPVFPHLVDLVLEYAPIGVRLAFRDTSRYWRTAVDKLLDRDGCHLVISRRRRGVRTTDTGLYYLDDGELFKVPRHLVRHARILDVHWKTKGSFLLERPYPISPRIIRIIGCPSFTFNRLSLWAPTIVESFQDLAPFNVERRRLYEYTYTGRPLDGRPLSPSCFQSITTRLVLHVYLDDVLGNPVQLSYPHLVGGQPRETVLIFHPLTKPLPTEGTFDVCLFFDIGLELLDTSSRFIIVDDSNVLGTVIGWDAKGPPIPRQSVYPYLVDNWVSRCQSVEARFDEEEYRPRVTELVEVITMEEHRERVGDEQFELETRVPRR